MMSAMLALISVPVEGMEVFVLVVAVLISCPSLKMVVAGVKPKV